MSDFTVMLVDDEEDFLHPLAKRLEKHTHEEKIIEAQMR